MSNKDLRRERPLVCESGVETERTTRESLPLEKVKTGHLWLSKVRAFPNSLSLEIVFEQATGGARGGKYTEILCRKGRRLPASAHALRDLAAVYISLSTLCGVSKDVFFQARESLENGRASRLEKPHCDSLSLSLSLLAVGRRPRRRCGWLCGLASSPVCAAAADWRPRTSRARWRPTFGRVF